MNTNKRASWFQAALCGMGLIAALGSTGCQITEGGQTLPSPYYQDDDVQYFPAGPEFKLTREAAALEAYRTEEAARKANRPGGF